MPLSHQSCNIFKLSILKCLVLSRLLWSPCSSSRRFLFRVVPPPWPRAGLASLSVPVPLPDIPLVDCGLWASEWLRQRGPSAPQRAPQCPTAPHRAPARRPRGCCPLAGHLIHRPLVRCVTPCPSVRLPLRSPNALLRFHSGGQGGGLHCRKSLVVNLHENIRR